MSSLLRMFVPDGISLEIRTSKLSIFRPASSPVTLTNNKKRPVYITTERDHDGLQNYRYYSSDDVIHFCKRYCTYRERNYIIILCYGVFFGYTKGLQYPEQLCTVVSLPARNSNLQFLAENRPHKSCLLYTSDAADD